ncbi:MAG: hypothetical protein ACE14L_15805 [Terriglobales bacterium]
MIFACIFVPDFPVEAVVRAAPELREQAVAVVEGTPPLLHVIAVNERARQAGVEIGMTRLEAEGRLSSAHAAWQVRLRSPAAEAAAYAALIDCACAFSPLVEADAKTPDRVLLDLAGLERLFGPPGKIARDLARRAAELGLETNVAVAANPDAAMHAARGFAGVTVIAPGQEAERLGPLLIDVLAPPPDTLDMLDRWGVRTFRALAALPETAVHERLGDAGVRLQRLARGETERPLVPTEAAAKFEEAVELEYPIELLDPLVFVLNGMVERLCARLAARALAAQELRLALTLDMAKEINHGFTRIYTDQKAKIENRKSKLGNRGGCHELTLRLPVPMLDAKVFLKLLQLELRAKPPAAPVETVFLSAEPVAPRFTQGGLFLPTAPEPEKLEVMLARIKAVVGEAPPANGDNAELRVGAAELLDTFRADAFRMKAFIAPPVDETQGPSTRAAKPVALARDDNFGSTPVILAQDEIRIGRTALRRFRPPIPVRVEVSNGRPISIFDFRFSIPEAPAATQMRAPQQIENRKSKIENVIFCAGPWLESGDWWTGTPWSREAWDVAMATAVYRIYRDTSSGEWFVEAMYD